MTAHALLAVSIFALSIAGASAQGVPNPFTGMGGDSDKPIAIAADSTVADIRNETATYQGNVRVEQGTLRLRSDSLAIKASKGTIMRIEAKGNVVLASPNGQATGATAVYDIAKRVVVMSGKVVLTQGQNVMRGAALTVDLSGGQANLSSPSGRVEGLFVPSKPPKAPPITNAQPVNP